MRLEKHQKYKIFVIYLAQSLQNHVYLSHLSWETKKFNGGFIQVSQCINIIYKHNLVIDILSIFGEKTPLMVSHQWFR